ncbi:TIGR04372 family glycosyltransferase [Bradyrhizobium ontarionense]|uniref:TIGR04372 family glycosyltransferase n=1 Tax=Bradyrhizobium ontarionense TaxID=2898149 RepID=A0ABY3RAS6_9BRAD|nr:TIGR04372 family glycosyltransferase [Bradyrhizobium sp. A19]UFZ04426.1 TIGR04372 family glycosyltransferase [Bradyrhizobium sp. A19]
MKLQKHRSKRLRHRRFVYLVFVVVGAILNLLPRRIVFLLLVIADVVRVPLRERLYQAYFPYVTSRLVDQPGFRFSTALSRCFHEASARVLSSIGAYREVVGAVRRETLSLDDTDIRYALVRSLFELGEFTDAREAAAGARPEELATVVDLAFHKAMVDMIAGDEAGALDAMYWACRGSPSFFRPHQNIAARNSKHYFPNTLDVLCGAPGRLFDLCNFTGQRVTHVGCGEIGIRLFERALDAQRDLRKSPPSLSDELKRLLDRLDVSLEALRLIPEEWATQIGHLGMLDILFRMRELGWWSGEAVIVVRPELIANAIFFKLFEGLGRIVVIGETISERVGEELLSLQRWYGLNFNAFRLPDGRTVAWQEAGAIAIEQWEREGRGHPLREIYDRTAAVSNVAAERFDELRSRHGLKPDDWYVCLHTRDAAHYFEFMGTGQTHRNAPIETSLDAIRLITSRGGWVIKLGGPNSPKLPAMERTIDYALSEFRSDLMDIHLIRHARAFIGTTSGLTNVAVSFGIPCAIVNAITTDAQLWNGNVRFALKPVRLTDGTMLTQRQLTTAPWRWRVFDAAVLGRSGAHPENNSADDILRTAEEVLAVADGRTAEFDGGHDADRLLSRWRRTLGLPYYYATSRPSLGFLARHEKDLLRDTAEGD